MSKTSLDPVDREAAAWILALMEGGAEQEVIDWQQHWSRHLDAMAVSEHYGDCRNIPMTCQRCLAEEALSLVPLFRRLANDFCAHAIGGRTQDHPPA